MVGYNVWSQAPSHVRAENSSIKIDELVVRASKQFRLTLDANRYSVPARYAGCRLTFKTYPDRLCIYDQDKLDYRAIYSNREVRDKVFSILTEIIPSDVDSYNASLLTPQIMDRINRVVVEYGHAIIGHCDCELLKRRCDSFVFETDVHFPTDINLLWDAVRKVIELISRLCDEVGIIEWRQYRQLPRNIKKLLDIAIRLKHSTSENEKKKALKTQQVIIVPLRPAHRGGLCLRACHRAVRRPGDHESKSAGQGGTQGRPGHGLRGGAAGNADP